MVLAPPARADQTVQPLRDRRQLERRSKAILARLRFLHHLLPQRRNPGNGQESLRLGDHLRPNQNRYREIGALAPRAASRAQDNSSESASNAHYKRRALA